MKKSIIYTLAAGLLLTSCGTTNNAGAIFTGASIGGSMGSAIGGLAGDSHRGWHGGYRGSAIGTIVGTLAGAAIGGAISSQKHQDRNEYQPEYAERYRSDVQDIRQSSSSNIDKLRIRNIRFIDANRDHAISSEESSQVIFEIMNEGNEPAYSVVPVVKTDNKKLFVSPSVLVEQIGPHNGIKYTAFIKAGKRLSDGSVNIYLTVADDNGREYDYQEFSLPTRR